MTAIFSIYRRAVLLVLLCVFAAAAPMARAADRDRLAAFLSVTGFDVALDSLRLSASAAPTMLGVEPGDFGDAWTRLADRVFDTTVMRDMALDILAETLGERELTHAAGFYATDLGQRLVAAENATHMMEDDAQKQAEGRKLISAMVEEGSPRLEDLKRMNRAIDASGQSAQALQEIQIRFLLAANAAGVLTLKMDPDELRAFMKTREPALRRSLAESALTGAAYTYRAFSDAEVSAYADALEQPDMQRVYELMNAVQYEIMANRFEVLAAEIAKLEAGQDI